MSIKQGKKLGFFASLAMLVGTVVGVGIFFKNSSISKATNGEGITWLLAWIFGGIIAAATAISFSEIGSMKLNTKKDGLPGWSEKLLGKKFGNFIEFNYSFFYWGSLVTVLGFIGSEMLIQPLVVSKTIKQIPIYAHVIIASLFITIFLTLNYLSIKTSGILQQISTIVKFIPLLFALIIGIVLPNINHGAGFNAFTKNQVNFKGLIVALPAVLFAYDAFMNVTTLNDKVENGEKRIPFIVLVGMLSIIVLYTLIAVSSILHNAGILAGDPKVGLIENVLPSSVSKAMGTTIFVFIFISTLGVMNGVAAAMISVFQKNIKQNTFLGVESIKKKFGETKTIILYLVIVVAFWTTIIGMPSIILNQDYLYDGFSNFPTLFFFVVYAIVILKYTIKRSSIEAKKINKYIFYFSAILAVSGIFLVVSYLIIDHYILSTIENPNQKSSWGLFAGTGSTKQWVEVVIFSIELIIFFAFPVINTVLKKYSQKTIIK